MSEIIAISDGLFSLIIVAREDGEVWANQRLEWAELSQSEASIDSQAAWVAAASISLLKQILTRSIYITRQQITRRFRIQDCHTFIGSVCLSRRLLLDYRALNPSDSDLQAVMFSWISLSTLSQQSLSCLLALS